MRSAQSGPTATGSAHHGKIKYRFGKIVDTDTTANDGQFNYAHGHANCKHNERLISGGLRWNHGSITAIVGHFSDGGIRPGQAGMDSDGQLRHGRRRTRRFRRRRHLRSPVGPELKSCVTPSG